MLQKRKWLLLTFYTTAGVMALERACTQAGLPGRIVPVPPVHHRRLRHGLAV